MKMIVVLTALSFVSFGAVAKGDGGGHSGGSHSSNHVASPGGSHSVAGHVRSNGTYVAPSHATNPNGTKADNWSTRGNVNP